MSETITPLSPSVLHLDDRAIIAIGGAGARSFLHNILSANIEVLTPGSGTLAALLTPQGKVLADVLVFDASDEEPLFLLDCLNGICDDLVARLTLYRLRSKVTINRLNDAIGVSVLLDAPAFEDETLYTFADPRHAALGQRLIGTRTEREAATAHFVRLDVTAYHRHRIVLGVPEGGKDYLLGDVFPHEVMMDLLHGVDFKKGCYIGQEIVSRMEHRGTTRTRALPVRFTNGFGVIGGQDVRAGERIIGRIGESFGDRAMALIRLDRWEDAQRDAITLSVGGVEIDVTPSAIFAIQPSPDGASR